MFAPAGTSLQGVTPGESGLGAVPPSDPVLVQPPAQEHFATLDAAGEVDQPPFRIAEHDASLDDRLHLAAEGGHRVPVLLRHFAPSVQRRGPADPFGPLQDHPAGLLDGPEGGPQLGQECVRLLLRVLGLLAHAITLCDCSRPRRGGSSSSVVIRVPRWSGKRPRRSSSTPSIPTASAGSVSNSGLSPTYTDSAGSTPARSSAIRKILGSGFSMPSTPEMTRMSKNRVTSSCSRRRSSHSSKLETRPRVSPASSSRDRVARTSGNRR